jgi:BolA family transcriptional regulator, general stress-responsive regulator
MDAIEQALRERLATLAPELLEIEDQSHLHAGHAGARDGGRHFRIHIVSRQFAGLTTLARHRLVYDTVGDLMNGPVHALAIVATPPTRNI